MMLDALFACDKKRSELQLDVFYFFAQLARKEEMNDRVVLL